MTEIAFKIHDERKAGLLLELLSTMDFVVDIQVNDVTTYRPADDLYQDPRQPLMEKEVAAFEKLHATLVRDYLDEYVAIHQGQVINHDIDQLNLVDRIENTCPNKVILIRQVQSKLPPPLIIRSPRLVRE